MIISFNLKGAMGEFTIGLILNISRNITTAINAAKNTDWRILRKDLYWQAGLSLKNSTVGIFGLGNIGMSVAKRLAGFDVKKIIYNNRKMNHEAQNLGYEHVSFERLLNESDFLIASCSVNEQNIGIFNKNAFDKMKKNAIFINVSRGLVVDHDALYDALASKSILGACLDVTNPQPLEPSNKLYSLENCFITPHIAWSERQTTDERLTQVLQNVINFYEGKSLNNEIFYKEN